MGFCIATAQLVGSQYPAFGSGVYLGLKPLLVDTVIPLMGTIPLVLTVSTMVMDHDSNEIVYCYCVSPTVWSLASFFSARTTLQSRIH